MLLIPALAAVLALAVWVSTPRLGALAAYELQVESPAPLHREPAAPVEIGPGGELSLLLRPRAASTEAVEASVFVEGAASGEPLKPVPATAQELGTGVLRVTVSGRALPESGQLVVLVGRSGLLPGSPVGAASHGRDWQRFELTFTRAALAAP